jgi:hypothetical protein
VQFHSWYKSQRISNRYSKKKKTCTLMLPAAYSQGLNVETTQMSSTDRHVDKQIVMSPCSGILFSLKKWWSTDACCSMNEPWRHQAEWKKPDTKMMVPFIGNAQNGKSIETVRRLMPGAAEWGGEEWLLSGWGSPMGLKRTFWNLIEVVGTCNWYSTKCHQIV